MNKGLYAQQVAELEELAAAEGITLPWPAEAIARLEATGAVVNLKTGTIYPGEADVPYRWEWTAKALARLWSGGLLLALSIGLVGLPARVQAATGQGVTVHIYEDANDNGQLDLGEPGKVGFLLTLIALDGEQVTGQVAEETDAAGNVDFGDLAPGLYGLALGDGAYGGYGIVAFTVVADSPGQQIVIGVHGAPTEVVQRVWLPLVAQGVGQ